MWKRTGPLRKARGPKLSLQDISSPRIQPELDGVRIGQLSDIHVRTGVKPRALHAGVEMLNALKPDFVVLTGDYVCLSVRSLPLLTEALKKLEIPTYATLGNHDHWTDARKVRQALASAGVEVLSNEHRRIDIGRGHLHLIGIDDSITRHHDPERAFKGVPAHATRVVLSHDPRSADFLHHYHPALILSGHTHGGQIYFKKLTPFLTRRAGIKYLSGLFDVHGSVLYVNRGIGASVPLRFRAPREVAQLTLRSAPKTGGA
ncbi:MAG TPA: metallophosphoesterase [Myxococcaceae bacterium]|nr:metallophosphoesterase [Myxococcaceae bacterium]